MTQEQKAKAYDEALERAKKQLEEAKVFDYKEEQIAYDIRTTTYAIFPELKESENEKIRQGMIRFLNSEKAEGIFTYEARQSWIAYLEKQKEQKPSINIDQLKSLMLQYLQEAANEKDDSAIEADTDKWARKILGYDFEQKSAEWSEEDEHRCKDAIYFLETAKKHYADTSEIELTIDWLKSLKPQPKQDWSEEDKFKLEDAITGIDVGIGFYETEGKHPNLLKAIIEAKDWLKSLRPQPRKEIYQTAKHDLAIKFMNYLDNNKPEGKMCLSNGECEDIDNAFKENDWAKIMRYAKKYQIQSEKKPEVKLTGWVARDGNGEIYVYGDYPEKDSERPIWIGSNSINLYQESFPNLKWENEPVEVEITIRKK